MARLSQDYVDIWVPIVWDGTQLNFAVTVPHYKVLAQMQQPIKVTAGSQLKAQSTVRATVPLLSQMPSLLGVEEAQATATVDAGALAYALLVAKDIISNYRSSLRDSATSSFSGLPVRLAIGQDGLRLQILTPGSILAADISIPIVESAGASALSISTTVLDFVEELARLGGQVHLKIGQTKLAAWNDEGYRVNSVGLNYTLRDITELHTLYAPVVQLASYADFKEWLGRFPVAGEVFNFRADGTQLHISSTTLNEITLETSIELANALEDLKAWSLPFKIDISGSEGKVEVCKTASGLKCLRVSLEHQSGVSTTLWASLILQDQPSRQSASSSNP